MTTPRRIALVTGGNKGLGFETSRQLAELGFTVWLGARDRARGEAAVQQLSGHGDVRFLRLDVTDENSVHAAARSVANETGLDILVNNAGIAIADGDGGPGTVQLDTLQDTFDVNVCGVLRVTQAFLPLLKRSRAGRIVNVSSTLGSLTVVTSPQNPFGEVRAFAYTASKTVLNAITAWQAVELRETPIKVNSVCPGSNQTDMSNTGAQLAAEGAKVIVTAATLPDNGPTGSFLDLHGTVAW